MSREIKQALRVFATIQRLTGGRLGLPATVTLCVVIVLFLWWSGASLPPASAPAPSTTNGPVSAERVEPGDLGGLLTDVGRGAYESPAGLRYTRGSRQGHRLAHVMRHSRDLPDRVGRHGVFGSDDAATIVKLLDEAYRQALADRDTETRREDGRTVHTVDLGRRVGYIGGRSGNRDGNPVAKHVRLVLEDNRVITAYPVIP